MTGSLVCFVGGGAVALVGLAWFVTRGRWIGRAMQPDHFAEVAGGLAVNRSALLRSPDGAAWASSAGVGVVYTVARDPEGGAQHHLSLSFGGGRMILGLGLPLVAFLARTVGIELSRLDVFTTESGILHVGVLLSATEHELWETNPFEVPAGAGLEEAYRLALEEREGLLSRLRRVSLDP